MFQSTLPRGVRPLVAVPRLPISLFQSTLPRGERPRQSVRCRSRPRFNPRSHEGSDFSSVRSLYAISVSIHAPTRGATQPVTVGVLHDAVSIHAPTRGATILFCLVFRWRSVSIHAPTRGATCRWPHRCRRHWCFNPRSHEGSDVATLLLDDGAVLFQSTLPRGKRLSFTGSSVRGM